MLSKLERKIGKYAIKNLMLYVSVYSFAGFLIRSVAGDFYFRWLAFDGSEILHGQVWRILTFPLGLFGNFQSRDFIFYLLMMYVYYSLGSTLEKVWGTFRFNFFYLIGFLFTIVANAVLWIILGQIGYYMFVTLSNAINTMYYLNLSLLLAFALTFPDMQFLLMFLIPLKAKYLLVGYAILLGYDVISAFSNWGVTVGVGTLVAVAFSLLNFFIYFMMTKRYLSPANLKRRAAFKRSYKAGAEEGMQARTVNPTTGKTMVTKHKCAVCGRTELDGDELEFRFCSRCNCNYEYCQDHLFTHTHRE